MAPVGGAGALRPVLLAVEEDPTKEALVEHLSDTWAAETVDLVNAFEQFEGTFECALDVLVDHLGCLEDAFGLVEIALDAFLFLACEVVGDGAAADPPGEAAALLADLFDAPAGAADLGLGSVVLGVQLDAQPVLDRLFDTRRGGARFARSARRPLRRRPRRGMAVGRWSAAGAGR